MNTLLNNNMQECKNNEEYLAFINGEAEEVKKADDGDYDFQPASHLKSLMDKIFGGEWSWDMDRETVGRGEAIGKGHLTYRHPVTGVFVHRSGTAALVLGKGLRMDYPKLETACMVNAMKKIGRAFGRDLNKDREDAPVIAVDTPVENDPELEAVMEQLIAVVYREEAEDLLRRSGFRFHHQLKEIVASKPIKIPE